MKAMILAAGRGERMRPLTDTAPKPMLMAGGKPLIQYHIENLVAAGFEYIVINTAWLGQQLEGFLGDGSAWGCHIVWSHEEQALETAGGIARALPLLGEEPFALVNGDIWSDYPLVRLRRLELMVGATACLVMVDNPPQHPQGDFLLRGDGLLTPRPDDDPAVPQAFTYSGIAVFSPQFFAGTSDDKLALRPLLDRSMQAETLQWEYYDGRWCDVGTPERLAELDATLAMP